MAATTAHSPENNYNNHFNNKQYTPNNNNNIHNTIITLFNTSTKNINTLLNTTLKALLQTLPISQHLPPPLLIHHLFHHSSNHLPHPLQIDQNVPFFYQFQIWDGGWCIFAPPIFSSPLTPPIFQTLLLSIREIKIIVIIITKKKEVPLYSSPLHVDTTWQQYGGGLAPFWISPPTTGV